MNIYQLFSSIGVTFSLIGILLILTPIIIKLIPTVDIEKILGIILYIYKRDGFVFATSPISIIIGIIYFLKMFLF